MSAIFLTQSSESQIIQGVMSGDDKTIDADLRDQGLRVTAARRAVLSWVSAHPHATVEDIHRGMSGHLTSVSKQAIYDVLAACVEARIVRQIKPNGHPARFERRAGDNHHHLVCRGCGGIVDTDCHTTQSPCLTPAHDHGFKIDEAEIVFWGLCKICQDA